MAKQKILIASSSLDRLNFEEVARILTERGYEVVLYAPDAIARGERGIEARVSPAGELTFSYDGKPFVPGAFAAAWYRRPGFYGPAKDRLRWLSVEHTYRILEKTIWLSMSDDVWLNAPAAMTKAENKLMQLVAAAACGFTVPETLISNSWDAVEALPYDTLAVKLGEQVIMPSAQGGKIFPTTILQRAALPKQALPYPAMWQPYISKKKEWRVTVVGERLFAAAVYTDKSAKDDWRKHVFGSGVTFKEEPFPIALHQKCFDLLRHYGLRYGAFDFVETPEGDIVFLEVNTNGQYKWLEHDLGLPISEAIADELVSIASAQ